MRTRNGNRPALGSALLLFAATAAACGKKAPAAADDAAPVTATAAADVAATAAETSGTTPAMQDAAARPTDVALPADAAPSSDAVQPRDAPPLDAGGDGPASGELEARARACIEKLGGATESSESEPRPGVESRSWANRTIHVATIGPGSRRRIFFGGPKWYIAVGTDAVIADLEAHRAQYPSLEEDLRPLLERLRAAGDVIQASEIAPADGPGSSRMQLDSAAATQVDAGAFGVVLPGARGSGTILVREEFGSQSGGRSGAGGRTYYDIDCTQLLQVIDWIS
jgi:hypothetical protein